MLSSCGNSGNSTEPHLHFQLRDGPRIEGSWGIEPVFRNVSFVRDGKPADIAEYTFEKGDSIAPSATSAAGGRRYIAVAVSRPGGLRPATGSKRRFSA